MHIFTLDLYKPTDLEQWICTQYQENGIHYASDLDIEHVADIFNIDIRTYSGPSFAQWEEDEYSLMFINGYLSEEQRREVFFHELCHPLRHTGCQDSRNMPAAFKELQEIQAARFQMYASMPFYMLEEFKEIQHQSSFIKLLSEAFVLPVKFVQQRIAQMMGRMHQERKDRNLRAKLSPAINRSWVHSAETERILDQLNTQLHNKKGASGQ
jgi:Zn-dependent peptidase ImmA (M78 family)